MISPQTSSDSDFLNFWKNTVVDSNILSENLKIQIVSWQSFCQKLRKNLQKDLKILTVFLYLRCVNDVKRKFTGTDMPCMKRKNSSLCSSLIINKIKRQKSDYSESKNHDIDSKTCKPTVFIKMEDGLKRIWSCWVKNSIASKWLR